MKKDRFGLCNSMVRIAESVRGTGAVLSSLSSIREALQLVDCCRQEERYDLAAELLDEIDALPLSKNDEVQLQTERQRLKVVQMETTPLIVFEASVGAKESDTPTLMIRGINFATALIRWASSGMQRRSQQEIEERLAICQACPQFIDNHCRVCGCPCIETNQLMNKLALASEACPLGKWK
jgi:uncharacterized protein (DUF885 family)